MSMEAKNLEEKVKEFEEELETLELKFHRSTDRIRTKTLLRMQKLTNEFLIWLAKRDVENQRKEQAKSTHDPEC